MMMEDRNSTDQVQGVNWTLLLSGHNKSLDLSALLIAFVRWSQQWFGCGGVEMWRALCWQTTKACLVAVVKFGGVLLTWFLQGSSASDWFPPR